MSERVPQIVAFGGGGFSMEAGNPLLDDYVLSLTGVERPKVCFLPTASGDADHYIVRFYRQFACAARAATSRCSGATAAAARWRATSAEHLLAAGPDLRRRRQRRSACSARGGRTGSTRCCGAAWRARRRAVRPVSAGSLCWFDEALTAFHGAPTRVDGLGLLPYSNCVHYDAEPERREEYGRFVGDGMRPGYAAEDGAALHFVGAELAPRRVVAAEAQARVPRGRRRRDESSPLLEYLGAAPVAA